MEAQTIIFMRGPMGLIQDIWGGERIGKRLKLKLPACKLQVI